MYSCFKCLKHGYFFLQIVCLYPYYNPKFFKSYKTNKYQK